MKAKDLLIFTFSRRGIACILPPMMGYFLMIVSIFMSAEGMI